NRQSNRQKPEITSQAHQPTVLRSLHVFADQKSQTGLFVGTVGITRASMRIGLANIVYNMRRFLFLERIRITA
ncbi:IS5/IS1182 family transposase, partial [Gluconobacter cerinus]|nr:IS5/IS1182 family transposase [Gluconobacter cerinus]